jgi:hypothetical protein
LLNGRPLSVEWIANNVDALVEGYNDAMLFWLVCNIILTLLDSIQAKLKELLLLKCYLEITILLVVFQLLSLKLWDKYLCIVWYMRTFYS